MAWLWRDAWKPQNLLIKPLSYTFVTAVQAYRPPPSMPAPVEFLNYIDSNADAFIKRLADAVAIPS